MTDDDELSGIQQSPDDLRDGGRIAESEGGDEVSAGIDGIERETEVEAGEGRDTNLGALPDQISEEGPTEISNQLNQLIALQRRSIQEMQLEQDVQERRAQPVSDQTTTTGSDGAAVVNLGYFRRSFEVYYNFENSDDNLFIDVSLDGSTWRRFARLDVTPSTLEDVAQGETSYTYVRVYPGEGFSDTNVNIVELIGRGSP